MTDLEVWNLAVEHLRDKGLTVEKNEQPTEAVFPCVAISLSSSPFGDSIDFLEVATECELNVNYYANSITELQEIIDDCRKVLYSLAFSRSNQTKPYRDLITNKYTQTEIFTNLKTNIKL